MTPGEDDLKHAPAAGPASRSKPPESPVGDVQGPRGHPAFCTNHGEPGGHRDTYCETCGWEGCTGWHKVDGLGGKYCPACGDEL
ncbi:MAG TPA: hypothetical protein VNZ52_17120 [Candidatus Thermoplasmatota archaeon]|nr:hypothetical protein [Candidatus Thermoplasmatota archaeon]